MSAGDGGARHAALAVASRRRLLEMLRSAGEPLDAAKLAATFGLHVTTARFHLDVLERAGLVRRAAPRGGRVGRPRQVYAVAEVPPAGEGYRQLADVLAGVLAVDPDAGGEWAERAGRRWAEQQVPADDGLSWDEATRRVGQLFERLGFEPRLADEASQRYLELGGCPFRDLARAYPSIVCAVHAGLLRGALSRLAVPTADRARLRPFVEPELCVADVPIPPQPQERRCDGARGADSILTKP